MNENNDGSNNENGTDKKSKMKDRFKEIRSNIESFISDVNVDDLKRSFGMMMKDAEKDFNQLINKDLESMKKKLREEKADFEQKAKKFMGEHRKEIDGLQSKLDKFMQVAKKATAKTSGEARTTKKKSTAKTATPPTAKAVKKVAKKVAKK